MPDADQIIEGKLHDWGDVLLRLRQMTSRDQGASIVRMQLLVIQGRPAYWFKPEKSVIEPAASARAFCDALEEMGEST